MRKHIDSSDRKLIAALAKRLAIVKKIGLLKILYQIPIEQKTRWNSIRRERMSWAKQSGVNPIVVGLIFELIHNEALRLQRTMTKRKKS